MTSVAAPKALMLSVGRPAGRLLHAHCRHPYAYHLLYCRSLCGRPHRIVSYRIRHAGFTTLKAWRTVFKFAGAMTSVAAAYASAPPTWAPSGTGIPAA